MADIKLGQFLHKETTAPVTAENPIHVQQSGSIDSVSLATNRILSPGGSTVVVSSEPFIYGALAVIGTADENVELEIFAQPNVDGSRQTGNMQRLVFRGLTGSQNAITHKFDGFGDGHSFVIINRSSTVTYTADDIILLKYPSAPVINFDQRSEKLTEYRWVSTETKPAGVQIPLYAEGLEMDTQTIYYWDGSQWEVF